MCGIVGVAWSDASAAVGGDVVVRMADRLTHRGPDESGTYVGDSAALGHRRLSIIGVSDGRQPISNEDGTVVVVFNGEIYNYRHLKQRLQNAGHLFKTSSDTEVLVHLYEELGLKAFGELNGMFAMAIWDSRRRMLVLARDRLGKKPLYYHSTSDRVVFASELKGIVELNSVPRRVDPRAVDAYLTFSYVPHPMTIFEGIWKLPPGACATWQSGSFHVRPYWQPNFNSEDGSRGREFWQEQLGAVLSDSVRLRLESEVPLGAFLSGGIDSTIIVGLMQELSNQTVRTFSIGFPMPEYDETRYARIAARHLGVHHEEFVVEPQALDILPKLVWHFDEPFADSSAIPTWHVSQLTKQRVTVALTGDGGDELFAGYHRYQAMQIRQRVEALPRWLRAMLGSPIWQRIPASPYRRSFLRRLKRFLGVVSLSPFELYLAILTTFRAAERTALYTDAFSSAVGTFDSLDFIREAAQKADHRDVVTRAMLTDLTTYLPCDLMTKVDIASMAHSLECRQPFLDFRVVELAAQIPLRFKLQGRDTKKILVDTFRRFLPEEIQTRSKMGFGVPIVHWFRGQLGEYAREVLTDRRSVQRGMFVPQAVAAMLDEHIGGRADHASRLWALLILELWHREWVDA